MGWTSRDVALIRRRSSRTSWQIMTTLEITEERKRAKKNIILKNLIIRTFMTREIGLQKMKR